LDNKTILAGNAKMMGDIKYDKPETAGTVVYLAVDGVYAGHIVIADELKPDSIKAIAALKTMGVKRTAMLPGDTKAAGEKIGRELGLDTVFSELLPQHKVERLENLFETKMSKGKIIFVSSRGRTWA
jgi:Cd2+/Zn2+-exporting ATPase